MGRKKVASANQSVNQAPPLPFETAAPAAPAVAKVTRQRRTAAAIEAEDAKNKRIRELQAAILEAQQFVALHTDARAQCERNVRAAKKKVGELQTELVKLMMPF